MNKKLIAVIAAIAIVVIAVSAIVLLTGDDEEYRSSNTEGRLLIMGNANGDDYLDGDDLDKIQEIIDDAVDWRDKFPLADANNDGRVDASDKEMVSRMIDRQEMRINLAYLDDGKYVVTEIGYPVKNVIAVGDNVVLALKTLGAESLIKGIALSDFEDPIFSDVKDIPSVKGKSTTVPSISLISNVADKDTVLVTTTSPRYVTNEAEIEQSGVPVIRFNVDGGSSGLESTMGALTIGYVLGLEERANDYVRFLDGILSDVDKAVSGIADKKTCIATNRTSNVSGISSEYYPITELAGGDNVIRADETLTKYKPGDDWLLNYSFEYIIHSTSMGFGKVDPAAEYATYSKNFVDLQAYKDGNFVLINANVPAPIRVAYIAEVFYPEKFESGYGDRLLQQFIDDYITNLSGNYDVKTDGSFKITA